MIDFTRELAGTLADGTAIEAITLTGAAGVSARILSYGATLQSLSSPDRDGVPADVLLGYDDLAGYVDRPSYFGVTVGRCANRIAGARFTLDGTVHTLRDNDHGQSLHGGGDGDALDRVAWRVVSIERGPVARVVLAYRSPHGAGGYPGNLDITVTYTLDMTGALGIVYAAATDRPTIVNMTNHAFFNLAGAGAPQGALGHRLTIPAAAFTPVDERLIPTGALAPVAGTAFDFRTPRTVADHIRDGRDPQLVRGRGYDHNFALDKGPTATPELAARLEDPGSGRVLEVLSTEPGLQFYAGNFLDGTRVGKSGRLYRMGDGIALEPQKFPDAPNQPTFPSIRVDPDAPYHHAMIYRLSVAD